jgi:hypothetical protein
VENSQASAEPPERCEVIRVHFFAILLTNHRKVIGTTPEKALRRMVIPQRDSPL